ncbi:MAG: hypothetical protein NUV77_26665, partial [Thermoguttaceae bacterium]|nr:hypothetical protein [Thermoguttaceae bacterium]
PVEGNTVADASGTVTDNGDGTYTVPLATGGLEPDRFQRGWLQDSQGYVYEIVSNTAASLTVLLSGNSEPPMSNGSVWFRDDDLLHDGQDVPMPDMSELANAMAEAYVKVMTDVGDNNGDVAFRLNLADYLQVRDWDSAAANSSSFWVAYLLGAFQEHPGYDNDPQAETSIRKGATLGTSGGSFIFLESTWDEALEFNYDPGEVERDLVVHELGHAVSGLGREIEPVTRRSEGVPSRYTEASLKAIRSSPRPLGP